MYSVLKELFQVICVILILTLPSSASSSELNNIFIQKNVLQYNATITSKNVAYLKELYFKSNIKSIELNSEGGEYNAGMDLATFIYKNHIKVHVSKICASSCTFSFFMIRPNMRSMNDDAVIAIHNISFTSNVDDNSKMCLNVKEITDFAEDASTKAAIMYSLYASVGIPPNVMLKSAQLRGNTALIITKKDLIDWGILK